MPARSAERRAGAPWILEFCLIFWECRVSSPSGEYGMSQGPRKGPRKGPGPSPATTATCCHSARFGGQSALVHHGGDAFLDLCLAAGNIRQELKACKTLDHLHGGAEALQIFERVLVLEGAVIDVGQHIGV